MDLVTFIAGVGPTTSFTPGANTPAPFNTTHTGLVDGTGPMDSSNNMAEIYNRIMLQIASVIVKSGLSIDNNNWAQLSDAVSAIATKTLSVSGNTLSISGGNGVALPVTGVSAGSYISVGGSGAVGSPYSVSVDLGSLIPAIFANVACADLTAALNRCGWTIPVGVGVGVGDAVGVGVGVGVAPPVGIGAF